MTDTNKQNGWRISVVLFALLGGCYGGHGPSGDPPPNPIEVGTGCLDFEPLDSSDLTIQPHVRGGWGICGQARILGYMPEPGKLTLAALDTEGNLVAETRFDEQHSFHEWREEWAIYLGGMLLFNDLGYEQVRELIGTRLRLRARAEVETGEVLEDEHEIRIAGIQE